MFPSPPLARGASRGGGASQPGSKTANNPPPFACGKSRVRTPTDLSHVRGYPCPTFSSSRCVEIESTESESPGMPTGLLRTNHRPLHLSPVPDLVHGLWAHVQVSHSAPCWPTVYGSTYPPPHGPNLRSPTARGRVAPSGSSGTLQASGPPATKHSATARPFVCAKSRA